MKGYSSKAVANWFIEEFWSSGRDITQLHLHKLVYIAHGWHLGFNPGGDGLIADQIYAWKYGPVVPPLWDEFKKFGGQPICRLADDWNVTPRLVFTAESKFDEQLLSWVLAQYGQLSGPELIEITHKAGSPWDQVTRGGTSVGTNLPIPNELIREYYVKLRKESFGDPHG